MDRLRAEAQLRLKHTEGMRRRLYCLIAVQLRDAKITDSEAAQMRREFWDARLRDRRIVKGEITALSSRSS
jgi:hypothetical protein